MNEKKAYEKPMIQDLGYILSGSAQMPMNTCTDGIGVSAGGSLCTTGTSVITPSNCGGGNAPFACSGGDTP